MNAVDGDMWDVIIIGTGMGGGAAGYWLAKSGLRVLFLEKGTDTHRFLDSSTSNSNPAYQFRLAAGWWPARLRVDLDSQEPHDIYTPLGCAVGGATAHFGGTLERFSSLDFSPDGSVEFPQDATGDGQWPFSYEQLEPFYGAAEKLLGVESKKPSSPGVDDIGTDESFGEMDKHFYDSFKSMGLSPYRQPLSATKYVNVPDNVLLGTKVGSREAFVLPAINKYGATIWDQCEVKYLKGSDSSVTEVVYNRLGQEGSVSGKVVLLAAGALFSPAILLRSIQQDPSTFSQLNTSGVVGKNLMFHLGSQFALWPRIKLPGKPKAGKNLALRDFYVVDGRKGGSVQSLGMQAGRSVIAATLRTLLEEKGLPKIPQKIIKLTALVAEKFFGRSEIFTCMIEDFPYSENGIVLDPKSPAGVTVKYHFSDELKSRATLVRRIIKRKFSKHRMYIIDRKPRLNYGHPCGTLRAGNLPEASVVNASCKVHQFSNLYVVDSSIFSTSGGVNPSLTVAANALRVADGLLTSGIFQSAEKINVNAEELSPEFSPYIFTEKAGRDFNDLKGKVVLVSGAGSGLGRALALHFCKLGANVVGIGRSESKLTETAALTGSNFTYYLADVGKVDDMSAVISTIVKNLGSIDILINNAAVYTKELLSLEDLDAWWSSFQINVKGPLTAALTVLPYMQAQGYGRVINIGSFADRFPLPGSTSYSVSKGALHSLTKSLSVERDPLAHANISIFEFVPGPMQTQMGSTAGALPDQFCYPISELVKMSPTYTNGQVFSRDNYRPVKKSFLGKVKRKIKSLIS